MKENMRGYFANKIGNSIIQKRVGIITIVVLGAFSGCVEPQSYIYGISTNLRDSRSKEVFIAEYDQIISDSIKEYYNLNFTEVFLEKAWKYRSLRDYTFRDNVRNKSQLVLKYRDEFMFHYFNTIEIVNESDPNIVLSIQEGEKLSSSPYESEVFSDTIKFSVIRKLDREIYGNITLIRKIPQL